MGLVIPVTIDINEHGNVITFLVLMISLNHMR